LASGREICAPSAVRWARNGVVEAADQQSRAEQLARRIDRVGNIINKLQIQKRSSQPRHKPWRKLETRFFSKSRQSARL
jgi:hypothetical protein